ncbi:hypothetical protein EDB81DRAFT_789345 [Dactylonectria macrodidyma]|uniref:GST N-terminal domain-containing protein n=1 Tax=Dactylonectria macrodidyma TaxID=307937 RepID=A0A9P9F432_9HYPO|nr:hypothetical protein EDB81DRAFT_789345 [Dactylonectria macrodidyma]
MSSASPIVLHDIPTKDPQRCWSWNTWKTRFILNFKGLDYVTEWIEYPDIKPTFEKYFPDETEFTCPTIRLADGETYLMESSKIAARLEADYPTPAIHLDLKSPQFDQLIHNLRAAMIPLRPVYIYLVLTRLLSDKSTPFFSTRRAEEIGMSVEQYHQECDVEAAWEEAGKGFSGLTAMLKANGGPFLTGQTVGYDDFICAGVLLFFKTLGDDVFAKLVKVSGDGGEAIKDLLEAVEPWSKRNSY